MYEVQYYGGSRPLVILSKVQQTTGNSFYYRL